jgi:hypothetical protein
MKLRPGSKSEMTDILMNATDGTEAFRLLLRSLQRAQIMALILEGFGSGQRTD